MAKKLLFDFRIRQSLPDAGSFLSDRFKTSVLFQGSAHFQHLDLVPNEGFQKSKNTNSVILHKVKSNQVNHGAWSVVNK